MSTIAQNEPTRVVLGVDSHRDSHTAVALDEIGRKLDQLTIDTTSSGSRQLMKWALRWSRGSHQDRPKIARPPGPSSTS